MMKMLCRSRNLRNRCLMRLKHTPWNISDSIFHSCRYPDTCIHLITCDGAHKRRWCRCTSWWWKLLFGTISHKSCNCEDHGGQQHWSFSKARNDITFLFTTSVKPQLNFTAMFWHLLNSHVCQFDQFDPRDFWQTNRASCWSCSNHGD